MVNKSFGRLGCILLFAGTAVATAQERVLGPMPSLAPLVEEVAPAVVNISVSGTRRVDNPLYSDPLFEEFFGGEVPERPLRGEGSGVIVDAARGYLLTNHHVIEDADEIEITLADGRTVEATVIGSDEATDLAVLHVDANNLQDIPFAGDDDLKVGDYVVAIGNPLGFENTVTAGIVSGLGRHGLNRNPQLDAYEDFIQTDASINLGNSGGALVNLRGEIVGINSAIISQTGGNIGIGLAIPSRIAVSVMDQLIEHGEVRRGFLGVGMDTVTPEDAAEYGSTGALVTEVREGSAADVAGIEMYDVITGINGIRVSSGDELRNRIGLIQPGQEVEIEVMRDRRPMRLTATLGERTPEALARLDEPAAPTQIIPGLELAPAQRGGITGLAITAVEPDSIPAQLGLRQGDLITFINRQRVATPQQAREIIESSPRLTLQIRRGDRDFLVRLP